MIARQQRPRDAKADMPAQMAGGVDDLNLQRACAENLAIRHKAVGLKGVIQPFAPAHKASLCQFLHRRAASAGGAAKSQYWCPSQLRKTWGGG